MRNQIFQKTMNTQVPMKRIAETEDLQRLLIVLCSKAGATISALEMNEVNHHPHSFNALPYS